MAEMETRSDSNLKFTYPYLFYEGVYSMDGRTLAPDYWDQQEDFLDKILALDPSDWLKKQFEAGDEEAIFGYAKESGVCFQSP